MEENNKENQNLSGNSNNEKPRIGVYVCHCGGNISDVVDVGKLVDAASKLPDVAVSKRNMFMCSDPGQNMVAEDIRDGKINRVVIAACSPSLHELTFRRTLQRSGLNPYLFEHVNIREQVSWVSGGDHQGAVDKAFRLISSGVAKARFLRSLEPIRSDASRNVVVIGGGISGLRCARDLSRRGFKVSLLERAPFLGGRVSQLGRVYPNEKDAREILHDIIKEVIIDDNITVYTQANVSDFWGFAGNFHLTIHLEPRGINENHDIEKINSIVREYSDTTENEFDYGLSKRKVVYKPYSDCFPSLSAVDWDLYKNCKECAEEFKKNGIVLDEKTEEIKVEAGAVIMATGVDNYEPPKGEFGYGEYPQVITLPQFKRLLDKEGPTGGKIVVNGKEAKNICFIHCVGSRQIEGIYEPPEGETVNDYCSRYCCTATLQAANEAKERFPDINIFDFYQDIRTYGRGHEDYYEKASTNGVVFFRYSPESLPEVQKSEGSQDLPLKVKVKDMLTFGEEIEVYSDLVVLSTGMVPSKIHGLIEKLKLPRSADGFLQEVHPKLRPVELAVDGVFIAGSCQSPMDISESCASATAAAAKAAAMLAKGYIESDPFVATINLEKCKGTGNCIKECSFVNAISLVEMNVNGKVVKRVKVNGALCKGCGMCVPVCPNHAVQVEGWRIEQYDAMVDAISSDVTI